VNRVVDSSDAAELWCSTGIQIRLPCRHACLWPRREWIPEKCRNFLPNTPACRSGCFLDKAATEKRWD